MNNAMSLFVSKEGSSVTLNLDISVDTYSEHIPGEGSDIHLLRSFETGKVVGCRLPFYKEKLFVHYDGPTQIFGKQRSDNQDPLYWIEDAANEIAKHVPDEVNSIQIEDIIIKHYKKNCEFLPGQVVVFNPDNFNPDYWSGLSEDDRIRYYGSLGYGGKKKKLFVFLSSILDKDGNDTGHCVLVDMDDQHIETMRHTSDFRLATDEEF